MKSYALTAVLFLSLSLPLLGQGGEEHSHPEDVPHSHPEEEEHTHATEAAGAAQGVPEGVVVQVDARSRSLLDMQIEEVPDSGSLTLTHSLYGYLMVPEHALETYALPCAGRISLKVKSAQQVSKGDVLYTLESPALMELLVELRTLQANIARCERELQAMEARLGRLAAVGSRNGELEEQLRFKQAEKEQLQQELAAGESRRRILALGAEQVDQDGLVLLVVRAHADGRVRNVGISQGSWGEQGVAVLTMSHLSAMEIMATLYGSAVPEIAAIRATIPMGRENVAVEGSWRVEEQPDPLRQTRALYFTPSHLPEGIQPGRLCRLDLYAPGDAQGTVSIPDSALVKVGVDDVVFLEVGEGRYAMVKVKAGASRRGMVTVSSLKPGQRLVVRGGYELKYILPGEGEKKKAGHFHADGKFHEGED